jgi:hypothetical protein
VNGYRFERLCRTPHSEAYVIADDEEVVARVDLHFTATDVYGVLVVERDLDEDAIEGLRQEIDDELVLTATTVRDDFSLAVYRGRPVRIEPFTDDVDPLDEDDL